MTGGHDPLAGVREGYDRWSAVYDHDANPLQALEEPRVREALGDPRGREVLDLGCGTGRHTAWLVEAGARTERYVGWPMLVVLDLRAAAITIPETQSGKAARAQWPRRGCSASAASRRARIRRICRAVRASSRAPGVAGAAMSSRVRAASSSIHRAPAPAAASV